MTIKIKYESERKRQGEIERLKGRQMGEIKKKRLTDKLSVSQKEGMEIFTTKELFHR